MCLAVLLCGGRLWASDLVAWARDEAENPIGSLGSYPLVPLIMWGGVAGIGVSLAGTPALGERIKR